MLFSRRGVLAALSALLAFAASPRAIAQTPAAAAAPAKTWTDRTFVGSDGTVFHYMEQGEGTPVILIHGLRSSAMSWFNTGAAQRLAKTNRVIALDMRGHGKTGPSPAGSKGTMIHDVVELMDGLKIAKAHIAGYSMGGATTAGLMREAPERFITAAPMGIGIKETAEWDGKTPKDPPVPASAVARPASASAAGAQAAAGAVTSAGMPNGAPPGAPNPWQDVDLTKIKFPVLALNGGYDTPLAKTHRMWRELTDFTYVVIPERNHGAAPRDPRFVDAFVRFIVAHNPSAP